VDDEDPLSSKARTTTANPSKNPSGGSPRRVFAFEIREMQRAAARFATYDELQNWVLKKARES